MFPFVCDINIVCNLCKDNVFRRPKKIYRHQNVSFTKAFQTNSVPAHHPRTRHCHFAISLPFFPPVAFRAIQLNPNRTAHIHDAACPSPPMILKNSRPKIKNGCLLEENEKNFIFASFTSERPSAQRMQGSAQITL
jgi:hypothetical protein